MTQEELQLEWDRWLVTCFYEQDKGSVIRLANEFRARLQKITSKWVGLNSFDRILLRTTYAPLKPLHHIKETDTTIVAEVVNDWEAFFAAVEEVLKEKNT
jgi:hypothetical protein